MTQLKYLYNALIFSAGIHIMTLQTYGENPVDTLSSKEKKG